MVQFSNLSYLPTLIFRWSEVKAIENLYGPQKKLLFPLFRMRPWPNTKKLSHAFEKAQTILNTQPFACDIDKFYDPKNSKAGSAQEFEKLVTGPDYTPWYDYLLNYENIIPCIQLDTALENITTNIARAEIIERGFGLITPLEDARCIDNLLNILPLIEHNNFFILIDAGWSKDPLSQSIKATALARRIIEINEHATTFLSSTSFPKSFSDIGINSDIPIHEFALFEEVNRQLARETNTGQVKYADWATTRPPGGSGGGGWIPRIDVPENKSIKSYRDRPKKIESISDACQRLAMLIKAQHPEWPTIPPSWGRYLLDTTASRGVGITHARMNSATRINMHIHNMVSEGFDAPPSTGEEPFDG